MQYRGGEGVGKVDWTRGPEQDFKNTDISYGHIENLFFVILVHDQLSGGWHHGMYVFPELTPDTA